MKNWMILDVKGSVYAVQQTFQITRLKEEYTYTLLKL